MAGLGETPAPHLRQATLICGLCICIYQHLCPSLSQRLSHSLPLCLLVGLFGLHNSSRNAAAGGTRCTRAERTTRKNDSCLKLVYYGA